LLLFLFLLFLGFANDFACEFLAMNWFKVFQSLIFQTKLGIPSEPASTCTQTNKQTKNRKKNTRETSKFGLEFMITMRVRKNR